MFPFRPLDVVGGLWSARTGWPWFCGHGRRLEDLLDEIVGQRRTRRPVAEDSRPAPR